MGDRNTNPLLDTQVCGLELQDGPVEELSTNLIDEKLFTQCENYGFMYHILDDIFNHKSTGDVFKGDDAFIQYKYGQQQHNTTKVWELCCFWNDGET